MHGLQRWNVPSAWHERGNRVYNVCGWLLVGFRPVCVHPVLAWDIRHSSRGVFNICVWVVQRWVLLQRWCYDEELRGWDVQRHGK